jgi:hypothetical protein
MSWLVWMDTFISNMLRQCCEKAQYAKAEGVKLPERVLN